MVVRERSFRRRRRGGSALSARAYHGIGKVARTIADLAERERISSPHQAEVFQHRSLNRGVQSEGRILWCPA